jgi:hypothetical protein
MPAPVCNEQHQPSCIAVPERSALLVTDPASTWIALLLFDHGASEQTLRFPIELRYLPLIVTKGREQ